MTGPMIVVAEFMDVAAVRHLAASCSVTYLPDHSGDHAGLSGHLPRCRALIVRNQTLVDRELLANAPNLACVGRLGAGLDNIDLEACKERSVTVYSEAGGNARSVAEYVITCALILIRGAYLHTPRVASGDWPRAACIGSEIAGRSLGLIGLGKTASYTAQLAQSLGLEVMAHDPLLEPDAPQWRDVRRLDLDALLASADLVSLHLPLVDDTRHLLNADKLAMMKPGACLINAARGGIVDEMALAECLRSGSLGGAALDVLEQEPATADSLARFRGVDRLLLTPHIAGVTRESNARISRSIADKVLAHLAANP